MRRILTVSALLSLLCLTSLSAAPNTSAMALPDLFRKAKEQVKLRAFDAALSTLEQIDAASRQPGLERDRAAPRYSLAFYKGVCHAALGKDEEARLEFHWNPKNRSPICYNPPATRSILPLVFQRTELVLAKLSKPQVIEKIKAAVARKELPTTEAGAMSYMMSKEGYLGDSVGHWHHHLMFHIPTTSSASWGAKLPRSPVFLGEEPKMNPEPVTTFMVPVGNWSDGTAA